jgi:ethanolamine-phosphate cytidylyltransferase
MDGAGKAFRQHRSFNASLNPICLGQTKDLCEIFWTFLPGRSAIIDFEFNGQCGVVTRKDATVVYVGGSWDCFSAGHVEYLRRARVAVQTTRPTMVVVGLWADEVCKCTHVQSKKCAHTRTRQTIKCVTGESPFLLLLERALAVIVCRVRFLHSDPSTDH